MPTPRDRRLFEALRVHTHLTAGQVRRLFFCKHGGFAAPQVVNVRMRKLMDAGFVSAVRLDHGHGAGPYAYTLSLAGRALLLGVPQRRRRLSSGPPWHDLEIADFRVALEEALHHRGGRVVEWVGEPQLRSLIRGRDLPVPDALVHWRLRDREGAFFFEHDRGSEPLATLTGKVGRYANFFRRRGHRRLLPGLGLRPRLAIVLPGTRAARLIRALRERDMPMTVLIGNQDNILHDPLARTWWRSDRNVLAGLTSH